MYAVGVGLRPAKLGRLLWADPGFQNLKVWNHWWVSVSI